MILVQECSFQQVVFLTAGIASGTGGQGGKGGQGGQGGRGGHGGEAGVVRALHQVVTQI